MIDSSPNDPELRIDPVTGRSVLFAPGRAARPMTLVHAEPHHRPPQHRNAEGVHCPFCAGNESDTPHETHAIRSASGLPNGPGWSLRVVPNKYPAVGGNNDDAYGLHEVVIPCPQHESNPLRLTDEQFAGMILAWRDRLRAYSHDPRLAYAQVFQNVGAEAGASLDHVHSQILATSFVPDAVREELTGSERYFDEFRHCVFCDCLVPGNDNRFVSTSDAFAAICPPVPRFAFETWILPAQHNSAFNTITDSNARELASFAKRVLSAIDSVLHEPAYNLILHTVPLRSDPLPGFHWHLEVIPQTARAAGYEWGAGVFINTVLPESSATALRNALTRG